MLILSLKITTKLIEPIKPEALQHLLCFGNSATISANACMFVLATWRYLLPSLCPFFLRHSCRFRSVALLSPRGEQSQLSGMPQPFNWFAFIGSIISIAQNYNLVKVTLFSHSYSLHNLEDFTFSLNRGSNNKFGAMHLFNIFRTHAAHRSL